MPDDLSDNERQLFRDAIAGISNQGYQDPDADDCPIKRNATGHDSPDYHSHADSLLEHLPPQRWVGRDQRISFARAGISDRQLKRLRNGDIRPESKFDLHGLPPAIAQQKTHEYLVNAQSNDNRCVLLIHGRGSLDPKNPPKLKNLLNQWLPSLPNVLAFVQSCPQDGGSGAIYVLLSPKPSRTSL